MKIFPEIRLKFDSRVYITAAIFYFQTFNLWAEANSLRVWTFWLFFSSLGVACLSARYQIHCDGSVAFVKSGRQEPNWVKPEGSSTPNLVQSGFIASVNDRELTDWYVRVEPSRNEGDLGEGCVHDNHHFASSFLAIFTLRMSSGTKRGESAC